jgi:hypothetical protein
LVEKNLHRWHIKTTATKRETPETYVKDTPLQITKREMQSAVKDPKLWVALIAAGIVLGISGPFSTEDALSVVPRVAYWLFVVVTLYLLAATISVFVITGLERRGWGAWSSVTASGFAAGFANFFFLLAVNPLIFNADFTCLRCLLFGAAQVVGVTLIICYTLAFFRMNGGRSEENQIPNELPRVLERLPFDKRGALISLSVSDHYVEVVTTKGSELLLLRLSDAMAETGNIEGIQVHRSHWVALDQVASAKRDGAKAVLTMSNGQEVPVSRTYVPVLKETGILPV